MCVSDFKKCDFKTRFKNEQNTVLITLRDRPFNLQGVGVGLWFFVSFRIFFQNLTLGYMTKTLNQIIFFPPPKSEYFFQQHWESEYFFRKKP